MQGSATMVRSTNEAPVADVFDLLAREIELAGARCMLLDSLVGELMGSLPSTERERLQHGLHSVDLLSQHLHGLSGFARRLSQDVDADCTTPTMPAIAGVTLSALADRMRTALGGEAKGLHDGDQAGEVDLF